MLRCPLALFFLLQAFVSSEWIFAGVDDEALEEARKTGERARVEYINRINGVSDQALRNEYYLDGLEACNVIDRPWTSAVESEATRHGRPEDAAWLEKAGLKSFTALFMTFPPALMTNVTTAACSKHEKQLQCGAVFEGIEQTKERVRELKSIGNHKMMFDKECRNPEWSAKVYPCIGNNVASWMGSCTKAVNSYAVLRDSVNARIEQVYDNAIATIKNLRDKSDAEEIFNRAMHSIVKMEGGKCALFKKSRVCVLRRLLDRCGPEAARAFNTSVSLGYLRTERRERLSLDFEVFRFPQHPNCAGL